MLGEIHQIYRTEPKLRVKTLDISINTPVCKYVSGEKPWETVEEQQQPEPAVDVESVDLGNQQLTEKQEHMTVHGTPPSGVELDLQIQADRQL